MFNHFSRYLKLIRAVPLHVMAQDLGIDAGLLSKYENGSRIPDLEAFLRGKRLGLEHKLKRKLRLVNPIVYDHSKAVNLIRFQYRRHGVINH